MGRKSKKVTSLWAVIEGMQKRLEAEGLDRDVVDAAVARGIEALLAVPQEREEPRKQKPVQRQSFWLRPRLPAKA